MVAQATRVPLAQLHAVEPDAAAVGAVELVEQVDERALAGSAQSDECCYLATLDVHGHIGQGFGAARVGEIHVPQLEVALDLAGLVGSRQLHLVVGLQDAEEALGIDEGVVHVVVDAV